MTHPAIPEDLQKSLHKFTRGASAVARCGLLMEQRLNAQISAENTRRTRKIKTNKLLHKGGVLYSKNARRINQEQLELEKAREKERDDA